MSGTTFPPRLFSPTVTIEVINRCWSTVISSPYYHGNITVSGGATSRLPYIQVAYSISPPTNLSLVVWL